MEAVAGYNFWVKVAAYQGIILLEKVRNRPRGVCWRHGSRQNAYCQSWGVGHRRVFRAFSFMKETPIKERPHGLDEW